MSKTYFLTPTRDIPPNGPIKLGSTITSPRSPEISLTNTISPSLLALPIHTHTITNSTHQLTHTKSGHVGIFTEFLNGVLGIGGDIGTDWEKGDSSTYEFKELVTQTISPDLESVRKIFEEEGVKAKIRDSRFRANLYMITGIKMARGADVIISKVKARGGNLYVGVDTTAVGVPIKVGPDVGGNVTNEESVKEHHDSDFVFAYRLRELVYRRRVVEKQKEFAKGDLMSVGKGRVMEGSDGLEVGDEVVEVRGVKGSDLGAEEWGLEARTLVDDDDGEECNVVVLGYDDDQEEEDH